MITLTQTLNLSGNTATYQDESAIMPIVVGLQATVTFAFYTDSDESDESQLTLTDPAGASDATTWRFVLAGDFYDETSNAFAVEATKTGVGTFSVDLTGTRTLQMLAYMGGDELREINAELIGLDSAGLANPVSVVQWKTIVRNRVDSINAAAPEQGETYVTASELSAFYTKTEADSTFATTSQVAGLAGSKANQSDLVALGISVNAVSTSLAGHVDPSSTSAHTISNITGLETALARIDALEARIEALEG